MTRILPAVGAALALCAAPASSETVRDGSFDQEVQAVTGDLQRQEAVGVFGRAGDILDEDAVAAGAVRDRDFDRYVERLGDELRMRNSAADRETGGVQ